METVLLLVRNLVFLVILAAFLEMLLPLQGTRRLVQVIIGLFILLAVLGPVASLFHQQLPLQLSMPANGSPAGQGGGTGLSDILERGQALQQVTSAQEQAAYVQQMEDQIAVICRLVPGVKAASVTVALNPSAPQQSLGTIQKVEVVLQVDGGQAAPPLANGQIDAGPAAATIPSEGEIAAQVRETVGSLFGLQDDQVSVTFNTTPR